MAGLFGGGSAPPAPKPAPPAPMPDEESPLVKEAERRRVATIAGRSGRASTILSQDEGSNSPYSGKTLG